MRATGAGTIRRREKYLWQTADLFGLVSVYISHQNGLNISEIRSAIYIRVSHIYTPSLTHTHTHSHTYTRLMHMRSCISINTFQISIN